MTILDAALKCRTHGISVVPVKPGTKRPDPTHLPRIPNAEGKLEPSWKPFQTEIAPEARIRDMFANGSILGIIAGHISGDLEGIDFDIPDKELLTEKGIPPAYGPFCEFLRECGLTELFERLVVIETKTGGIHLLYRCPDGVQSNQKLAQRPSTKEELARKPGERVKVLIETRGEGGYMVTVPSPGYKILQGSLAKIPVITGDEREILLNAARLFNEKVVEVTPERTDPTLNRPGDWFNQHMDWADVLQPHRWELFRKTTGNRRLWMRPDISSKDHGSASDNNGPNDLLYIHSSSAHPFEHEHSYSKFKAYAMLEFGTTKEDEKKAAAKIRRELMPKDERPVSPKTSTDSYRVQETPVPDAYSEGHGDIPDEETGEYGSQEATQLFQLLTLQDLVKLPDIDWLIQDFLPKDGLGMVYGLPGSGKTFMVVDLAFTLAKAPWLYAKTFPVQSTARIVYAAGEKVSGLKKRFQAAMEYHQLTEEQAANIRVCKGVPQLFDQALDQSVAVFISQLTDTFPDGFDLLIIDTLHSASVGADENSATDAGREIYMVRKIQEHFGCAVIVIHHSKKSGDDVRGSSAWKGALDTLLKVEKRGDGEHVLLCEKMGDAADNFTIQFSLEFVPEADSLRVNWKGRVDADTRTAAQECERIGKEMPDRWLESAEWFELCALESVKSARVLGQTLKRLAEKGESATGFSQQPKDPNREWTLKKNPYVYRYSPSAIIQQAAPYKDE